MHGPTSRATCRQAPRGFTLIELTVVLAVIVTLALILTPSITNFISDSRKVRAQSDVQKIGAAVVDFYRDTGFFPQWNTSVTGGRGLPQAALQVLMSGGTAPLEEQPTLWTTGRAGMLVDQLLVNAPGYAVRTATSQFGWNGPYLSSELRSDPWGNRYLVNIGLIDTSSGVMTLSGRPKAAVWVLSAGPNGTVETPFSQPVTTAYPGGDDVAFRIQ
ncbi:MAG: prepilin-type N-terminal cleavage/methylation domain-containing protein [Vicinamibacterales bacterium]|nr:prepilin-type N-terminal cleavage/methylation domain-containing protein [Vicinamibacterales bacterium]